MPGLREHGWSGARRPVGADPPTTHWAGSHLAPRYGLGAEGAGQPDPRTGAPIRPRRRPGPADTGVPRPPAGRGTSESVSPGAARTGEAEQFNTFKNALAEFAKDTEVFLPQAVSTSREVQTA